MRARLQRLIYLLMRRWDPVRAARFIGVKVGSGCRLIDVVFSTEPYLVTMGDHVSATGTRFETHDGGVWVFRNELPDIDIVKAIRVGSNVYIGYGCIILPGVTIGDDVIIGAGSIVSRDIPSGSVAVGCPARVIKSLSEYRGKALQTGSMTKRMGRREKREFYLSKFRVG